MWQRGRKDGGAKGFLFLVFNYFYFLLGEVYKGVGRAWRPGKLGCMVWNFQRLNFKNYTKRNLRKKSIQKRKEGRKERLLQSKKDDSWRGVESRTGAVPGERNRGVGHLWLTAAEWVGIRTRQKRHPWYFRSWETVRSFWGHFEDLPYSIFSF